MQEKPKIEDQIIEMNNHFLVLIAEDEYVNYFYLEELLNIYNPEITIFHAKNGQEALDLCREKNFDLILMDIKMPVLNGLEATKKIKEIRPDFKIIAQTAFSNSDEKRKTLDAGCDDFIAKPISFEDLTSILEKYLLVQRQ